MTITLQNILDRAQDLGLTVQTQKAYFKIARNKKAVYLPRTKNVLKVAHVSGFRVDSPAVVPPPKKNGCVTGHIRLGHPESLEALLAAFCRVKGEDLGTKLEVNGAAFAI